MLRALGLPNVCRAALPATAPSLPLLRPWPLQRPWALPPHRPIPHYLRFGPAPLASFFRAGVGVPATVVSSSKTLVSRYGTGPRNVPVTYQIRPWPQTWYQNLVTDPCNFINPALERFWYVFNVTNPAPERSWYLSNVAIQILHSDEPGTYLTSQIQPGNAWNDPGTYSAPQIMPWSAAGACQTSHILHPGEPGILRRPERSWYLFNITNPDLERSWYLSNVTNPSLERFWYMFHVTSPALERFWYIVPNPAPA